MMKTKPLLSSRLAFPQLLLAMLVACGGDSGSSRTPPPPATYSVGGNVAGLVGSDLVLQNNGGDDLAVSAAGAFAFTARLANGAAYAVTVKAQPSSPTQNCVVTNGSGTVGTASITTVAVACSMATYTVGGVVSGLEGSGLSLSSGADNLAISSNGSFTFATPIATGDMYHVTLDAQPVTPSQVCVLANGSGVVANTNVIDVSVACTTGVFNANLNGTFKVIEYRYGGGIFEGLGDAADLFTLTFDGAGNFSGTDTLNKTGGVVVSNPISGTYVIAADGTLTIIRVGSSLTGRLSADGNRLVVSQTIPGKAPAIAVGIKQGQTDFSNADLRSSYVMVDYRHDSAGDIVTFSTVSFDGAGNVSGSGTQNSSGTISTQAYSATYAVAADGTLTVSPTSGSPMTGGLSADRSTLVISQMTSGDSPEVLVGINQGLANPTGTYATVGYRYNSAGDSSSLSGLTFSGGARGQYFFSGGDHGIYDVSYGALTLTSFGGRTLSGGVSFGANTVVTAQVTSQQAPDFTVAIR
jgi:hypothetical protein